MKSFLTTWREGGALVRSDESRNEDDEKKHRFMLA
jgi:hypothetical protein